MISPEDAGRKISELLHRTMVSGGTMQSALDVLRMAPHIEDKVLDEHLTGASGLREFMKSTNLLPDEAADFNKIAKIFAKQMTVNAETVIAAAVVILSHSTADDVFTGACELAIDLDEKGWASELNMERTVALKLLAEKSVEQLFASELGRLKKQLSDKSLPNRAEIFFRHVPIRLNTDIEKSSPAYFDMSRLKEADRLRHEIVHGTGLRRIGRVDGNKMRLFLHEAATTALRSLGYLFPDAKLNQDVFFHGVTSPGSEEASTQH